MRDFQVDVDRNCGSDDQQTGKPRVSGADRAREDQHLCGEPRSGWQAGEPEQEERHRRREPRAAVPQPRVRRQARTLLVLAREQCGNGECAEVHERIRAEVEDRVAQAERRRAGQSGDDIPQLRDPGVREKPLDIVLCERCHVAHDHRDRSDDPERREQRVRLGVRQRGIGEAREHGERSGLGDHAHKRGDRQRRAFVDVGSPNVERNEAQLEAQPDQKHAAADSEERLRSDGARERGERDAPCGAEEERHTVEHEGGRGGREAKPQRQ